MMAMGGCVGFEYGRRKHRRTREGDRSAKRKRGRKMLEGRREKQGIVEVVSEGKRSGGKKGEVRE